MIFGGKRVQNAVQDPARLGEVREMKELTGQSLTARQALLELAKFAPAPFVSKQDNCWLEYRVFPEYTATKPGDDTPFQFLRAVHRMEVIENMDVSGSPDVMTAVLGWVLDDDVHVTVFTEGEGKTKRCTLIRFWLK